MIFYKCIVPWDSSPFCTTICEDTVGSLFPDPHHGLANPSIWSIWAPFLPIFLWGWWKYLSNLHVVDPSFQNAANIPSIRGGNIGTEARPVGWMKRWKYVVVVSNSFYCHPDPWGNDPIWLPHIFQMVGDKPPTRNRYMISSWSTAASKFWLTFLKDIIAHHAPLALTLA